MRRQASLPAPACRYAAYVAFSCELRGAPFVQRANGLVLGSALLGILAWALRMGYLTLSSL